MNRMRQLAAVFLLLGVSLAGCNMAGNIGYRDIEVRGSNIGIQFVPRQLTRTLENAGYQRREISAYIRDYGDRIDGVRTLESGMLIDSSIDYRMVFGAVDMPEFLVSMRVVKRTGTINIGLIENDSRTLSAAGIAKRDELVAILGNLYGPENVTVRD